MVCGPVARMVRGPVAGMVCSHVAGMVRGYMAGMVCGQVAGMVRGPVAGMVCGHLATLFSFSVRICTHLGHSELIFCSAFWPAATFPGKWINTGSMAQPEQQIAANQWEMLECRTRILETHPEQTLTLPRAAHSLLQGWAPGETGRVVLQSEPAQSLSSCCYWIWGMQRLHTPQHPPASAADSPKQELQELFPFTTVVFLTRVGTHTRKRTLVLSNNNTMLYSTQ